MKLMEENNNQVIAEKEKKGYLAAVEELVKMMLNLSNKGINKFNDKEMIMLCGIIRDCAFKIKKNIKK